ncbi:phosphoribosylglycinamide formyltransferase [Moesziomyces antarcticus]|uniref:phosphoribosylglycinamide formyltransferase 1 n=1 Tax=Pseudozyma antarctica TaxID=84753 RepID=A0A5C3FEU3_PSEA2|nr:phosphoribosylglycinamide formyltransferase [Moesziomyces antarcticus]GAK62194.1 phosphoribosylglycinamide formyltransferase [Moesziomyces antarcticus]SPO42730.1 related to glycinamide ribonucleotide transformylase [Moesziomyces antarcticus]
MSFSHHHVSSQRTPNASGSSENVSSASDGTSQDLASWVDQVRQRSSASATSSDIQGSSGLADTAPTSSASELEQEFQRQRLERQQRRDRLSVSGIRGISSQSNSPLATPSLDPPSFAAAAMAPPDASQSPSASPLLDASPPKASGVTGIKRANSLLARYGGQYGPTGIAAGPRGPNESPVSLANFMGGKAAGPRLGKLAGDGKSAPPEAELIHESRRVPLPGMSPHSGRSLASFLEERADASGKRRTGDGAPASLVKDSPTPASPTKASSSPAKYGYASAELGRPLRTATDPPSYQTGAFGNAASARPASPKKAYLELMEKQNTPRTSAPPSPVIPRASSPSKFHRFTAAESASASPLLDRPASPLKGSLAPSPVRDESVGIVAPNNSTSRPLPIPKAHSSSHAEAHSTERKDAATSPFKPEDIVDPSATGVVAAARAQPKPDDGLGRGWTQSTEQSDTAASQPSSRSASLAASELSGADRMPTASLSRLSAKKMVGQRIKEAQLRDSVAQKEYDAMQVGSAGRSVPSSPAVRDRWPPAVQTNMSPVRSNSDERKAGSPWSPTKYGNALPGLAGRSPTKEAPSSPWLSSPSKKAEMTAEPRAEPIRLPGMGASVSPFARSADRNVTTDAATIGSNVDVPGQGTSTADQVLTPLTKARAKGPIRRGAPTEAKASPSPADVMPAPTPSAEKAASTPAVQESSKPVSAPKPPRRTSGKRIHVLVSGSGSNLQSLIDATLLDPPPGLPIIENAQISFVLSNRKAAYGLTRAAESNPPIPTKVLALKTWQNRNPGGTREQYDQVLARAVLDGPYPEGTGAPPDLIVLAGFMHIVSEPFLHALGHTTSLPANTPTLGARPAKAVPIINLHPALPGAFDGANAIPRAFEAHQQGLIKKTGCMVHEVVADVDRGRPIIVREVDILPTYKLEDLEQAIHKVEHVIIVQAADLVLKGHLEELDRQEAATKHEKAAAIAPASKPSPLEIVELGSELAGGEAIAAAPSIVKAARSAIAKYAILANVVSSSHTSAASSNVKTVSVEVLAIDADGFVEALEFSGDQTFQRSEQLRREQILYNDETLAVVKRLKTDAGQTETKLWVRTGQASALHPFEYGPHSTSCSEGRKVQELAQRYACKPEMIPSGCEPDELIASLSGTWAISRQGSRKRFDAAASSLYHIRAAVGSSPGPGQRFAIQQVELQTTNLCSGDSFVFLMLSSLGVWHGRGASTAVRAAAVRFAQALAKSGSSGARSSEGMVEMEEGSEAALFWNVFDKSQEYASAWFHRHDKGARTDASSLVDVELRGQDLQLQPVTSNGYFGAHDLLLPTRSTKISILNLRDEELYVVVGRDARSDRPRLACAIQAAEMLAEQLQAKLRGAAASEGAVVARPAVHVLVLPSKVPREIRAASRVWSDKMAEYLQGEAPGRMNVCSSDSALEQLGKRSWPRWALSDASYLPVGVSPEDVSM